MTLNPVLCTSRPCNQFGAQEPGTPAQITSFVKDKFGADFTIMVGCSIGAMCNGRGPQPASATAVSTGFVNQSGCAIEAAVTLCLLSCTNLSVLATCGWRMAGSRHCVLLLTQHWAVLRSMSHLKFTKEYTAVVEVWLMP